MSDYIDYLDDVARGDAEALKRAQEAYGDSWKRRGGVGAFMMLARKWDRLEKRVEQSILDGSEGGSDLHLEAVRVSAAPYDIFGHIQQDARPEGIIDDIRDLRRYLMLVEAEMIARGYDRGEVRSEG